MTITDDDLAYHAKTITAGITVHHTPRIYWPASITARITPHHAGHDDAGGVYVVHPITAPGSKKASQADRKASQI